MIRETKKQKQNKELEHVDFIDWVREKSTVKIFKDKRAKKKYNLERWLVNDNGVFKEIVKKVFVEKEQEENPALHKLNYDTVPNTITDYWEECDAYETFGRRVLGRNGWRTVPNKQLAELRAIDKAKREKLLAMIYDKRLVLYRRLLTLKYRIIAVPSLRNYRNWRRVKPEVKQHLNELINNYIIDSKSVTNEH